MTPRSTPADVAVIGFGFSGLCVVANLIRRAPDLRVAVVGDALTGHGPAYATRDPGHLLNVEADRMGLWADDPDHFAWWLQGRRARLTAAELGVTLPGPGDYAPRALYADYLSSLRDNAILQARAGVALHRGRATSLAREGELWRIGGDEVHARHCVLATGHDRRGVFGSFTHPHLHRDPWALPEIADDGRPVVLVGSSLTAIDAVLTLRARGHRGPIHAVSRHGRLPAAHLPGAVVAEMSVEAADRLSSPSAVVDHLRRGGPAGQWRTRLEQLRPHVPRLWQRLDPDAQRTAAQRWSGLWGVHRHRMAPDVAAAIEDERRRGRLTVTAVAELAPRADADGLALTLRRHGDATATTLHPAAIVDCTGSALRLGPDAQPLLAQLIADGLVAEHPTGLGLAADPAHRVAPGLYALGTLLTGQLWESVAVPELRVQAASIADAIVAEHGAPGATTPPYADSTDSTDSAQAVVGPGR